MSAFPDLFGNRLLIVLSHLVVALLYVAFRLVIYCSTADERRPAALRRLSRQRLKL